MDKVTCLNPNTGSTMNIDKNVYELFHGAISAALAGSEAISFTEIVERVSKQFKKSKAAFSGSVSWYAVTVKNDMQSRGQLEVFTKQGKKLHKLKKQ
jgi:hypothetical protein